MIPWVELGRAAIPGSEGTLRLKQRGHEFSIMLGTNELMNSRMSGSEEALASLTAERLNNAEKANVLIGGYGMGFTLRAALDHFGSTSRLTVSELVPEIIDWARGPMQAITNGSLDDRRVQIAIGDVGQEIRAQTDHYDAILLDVDNGPEGLSREGNDALYNPRGLDAARRALKAGGILAVWSQAPDAAFMRRLTRAGFKVEEVGVKANAGRNGRRHIIWLAQK